MCKRSSAHANRFCLADFTITPGSWILGKKIVGQLLKKFLVFCGSCRFTTMFTRVCHQSLSWARWIQYTSSHLTFLGFILTFSHLCPVLSSRFFAAKTWCALFLPMHLTCPAHLFLLYLIILTVFGEEQKSWSSSLEILLYTVITCGMEASNAGKAVRGSDYGYTN
jgi:hypothetical protein